MPTNLSEDLYGASFAGFVARYAGPARAYPRHRFRCLPRMVRGRLRFFQLEGGFRRAFFCHDGCRHDFLRMVGDRDSASLKSTLPHSIHRTVFTAQYSPHRVHHTASREILGISGPSLSTNPSSERIEKSTVVAWLDPGSSGEACCPHWIRSGREFLPDFTHRGRWIPISRKGLKGGGAGCRRNSLRRRDPWSSCSSAGKSPQGQEFVFISKKGSRIPPLVPKLSCRRPYIGVFQGAGN